MEQQEKLEKCLEQLNEVKAQLADDANLAAPDWGAIIKIIIDILAKIIPVILGAVVPRLK